MELCDYDLDYLVKVDPFKEENIIVFLFQLGEDCSCFTWGLCMGIVVLVS